MEPLVVFGACLVVWCGYIAAFDAVREWRAHWSHTPARRKIVKKRVNALAAGIGSRLPGDMAAGKPLMQRA